ncbi:protein PBDC1 isoform X2 [Narcine bancroftii]|uniref:protein PBDC1 isoform X2 n=1 Tax=Narcine bancroftii TaxID=1343680 RepID=UPI0038313F39
MAGSGLGALGSAELMSAAQALSLPADAYGNDTNVEMMWAIKAYQHAEIYFNLISSVDPRYLRLTKEDDMIYREFRTHFGSMKVDVLDPDQLKSETAKLAWRPFCLQFETLVEDFNYGTLLRLDCTKDYTEENTIFATRIQFLAIEVTRNREGFNSPLFLHSVHSAHANHKGCMADVAT